MGLYDYMTPEELEYAKESAQIDNESLKFEHEFQILALEHTMRIHDIDTHALLDNYTEAVLEDAYTEELRVYEEGVKEAWEKFKAWLISVINTILGKKNVEPADIPAEDKKKKIKLPFDLKEVKDKLAKVPAAIQKVFSNDEGDPDATKIAAALGLAAAAGGLIGWINNVKKGEKETEVTVDDGLATIPFITKFVNDIKGLLGKLKEKPGIEKILSNITNFAGWVKNKINGAISAVTGAAQAVEDKASVAGAKMGMKIREGAKNITNKALEANRKVKREQASKNVEKGVESGYLGAGFGEATNDLLASMDDISFYEESASLDLIMETVGAEDMKEIDSLLESL